MAECFYREILKQKDFELDVKQESEKLREPLEFVQRAGFHMGQFVNDHLSLVT